MSNIFIKSAREQIVYGATIDYKEWHMIDEVVSNYGVPLGVTECVGRIVRCLKELKDSLKMFEDPEVSVTIQYKEFIKKTNAELHENYQELFSFSNLDEELISKMKESRPSDYMSLYDICFCKAKEVQEIFKNGKKLQDFKKLDGFEDVITRRQLTQNKRMSKNEEDFLRRCAYEMYERNEELFISYDFYFAIHFPDLKERVCEGFYTHFKENPELVKIEGGQ